MTYQDLGWLREQSIRSFKEMRADRRMVGGPKRDLEVEEMRFLAIFDASVRLMAKEGLLAPGVAEKDPIGFFDRDFRSTFEEG